MRKHGFVLLVVLAGLLAFGRPSEAAKVAVFGDPTFVDTSPPPGEFEGIKASLIALGHTVGTFTGNGAPAWQAVLDTSDVLLVPELELGDLNAVISDTTRALIVSFVLKGKPMIMIGDNGQKSVPFLNNLFGYSLVFGGQASTGNATQQPGAAGTPFAASPANVAMQSATSAVTGASLPPGARSIYENAGNPVVFATTVGGVGRLVYLGYDWFGTPSPEWVALLAQSITFGLAATPKPLTIAMFNDPGFVDVTREALNIQNAMSAMGHNVIPFTGLAEPTWTAALAVADVLVIPELESGDLAASLPTATKVAIQKYVLGGGGLVLNDAGSNSSAMFNLLFGFGVSSSGAGGPYALNLGAAAGTVFAGGPATIPQSNATETLIGLPAGALALYTNAGNSAVWAARRGLGHMTYLGFDWFAITNYVPWLPTLSCALQFGGQPVALAPNAPGAPAGSNGNITVDLSQAAAISSVALRFRQGGDNVFLTTTLGPIGNAAAATIPGAQLTNKGVQYYIELSDGIATGTFPRNAPHVSLNLPVTLTNQAILSLPASSYRLAGVPMAATNTSPTSVFDELGGYDVTKWRYGTFDGTSYHEPGAGAANATPGTGFWIIARDAANITTSGTSTNLGGPTIVTLHPGFNQIADPYAFPVDFADVVLPAGVEVNLISFNGSTYVPGVATLQPGEGYWIKNTNGSNVQIAIPPLGAGATPVPHAALTPAAEDGWSLGVDAYAGRFADIGNVMGARTGALEGHDAFDLSEPPAPPQGWVRLSFSEPGQDALLADWRPKSATGSTWQVSFESDQAGQPFHIDLAPRRALPAGWGIAAFEGSREIDLGAESRITGVVGSSTAARTFTVSVGSPAYLASVRSNALSTITSFALSTPFPNPMRSSVSVDLALPRAESDVRVEVFDASGRLVRTLLSGAQEAGIRRLQWDGLANGGQRADVGLYFVRARAGAQLTSRKVALVR